MKQMAICILLISLFVSCVSSNKEAFELGSIQVMTGQMSKYGKTLQAALDAQLEIINEERKEQQLPLINITYYDDKLDPKTGVSCLQQLIQIKKIPVCFGALGSSVTMAMAPLANRNEVVLISPASGAPEITNAGEYIFRTCPSDLYEANVCADYYLANLKGKHLSIIYINNDYGVGLKDAFLNRISDSGKVETYAFQQGQSDFRTILSRIKQQKTEVIYLIGYEEMIAVYKQAMELNVVCAWLGNNQMNDPDMVAKFGEWANGTIFPGHQYNLDSIKVTYPKFYAKYKKYSGGVELDVFAAYGVDALIAVYNAIKNGAVTGREIKEQLQNMGKISGMTGIFAFDENGDPIRKLDLYRIENGKYFKF